MAMLVDVEISQEEYEMNQFNYFKFSRLYQVYMIILNQLIYTWCMRLLFAIKRSWTLEKSSWDFLSSTQRTNDYAFAIKFLSLRIPGKYE